MGGLYEVQETGAEEALVHSSRDRFRGSDGRSAPEDEEMSPANDERKLDSQPLRFGKHKGKTPRDIAREDPTYITWLRANVLPPVVSRDLALECEDSQRDRDGDQFGADEFAEE